MLKFRVRQKYQIVTSLFDTLFLYIIFVPISLKLTHTTIYINFRLMFIAHISWSALHF